MTKDKKADDMYEQYGNGFSLSEVGRMFGVTRQSVYIMFKRRGFELRSKRMLPFLMFNELKFSPQSNGYYRKSNGNRELMHRHVWEYFHGKIPDNHDIHHKDFNRSNNMIENLEIYRKDIHARKFNSGQNQYTKKRNESG